jgi:hypothetical protein
MGENRYDFGIGTWWLRDVDRHDFWILQDSLRGPQDSPRIRIKPENMSYSFILWMGQRNPEIHQFGMVEAL